MATALTSEYTRFTDKCNKVLAGGIVKTFEPNSLTPKISYQDPNKEIPNLTEVRLDETGRAKIYIDGDYRIQVYSRDGVLIEDNLLVEQSLVQRDFTSLSQALELEQQEKLNQFQTQADQSIQDLLRHGGRAYPTLALANADIANIALDTKVTVLSTTDGGDWYKATAGSTSLTKSPYDPLTQAKADATTKANAAEANAKTYADTNKLDLSKIITGYLGGNKIGPKTPRYTNLGVTGIGGNVSTSSNLDSVVLQVKEGDDLYIENSANTFISNNGARLSFFAEDPNLNRTQTAITHTAANITTPVNHWKITVPVGAKYLMLNTRSVVAGTTYNLDWSVHENAYDPSFSAGDETVTSIQGVDVGKYAKLAADKAELNAKTYADSLPKLDFPIVSSSDSAEKLLAVVAGSFLGTTTVPIIQPATSDKFSYLINVKPNTAYTLLTKPSASAWIREFSDRPVKLGRAEAQNGFTASATSVAEYSGGYSTFTTAATTKFIVLDPRVYIDSSFVLYGGAYDVRAWEGFTKQVQQKSLTIDVLNAKRLISDDIVSSKNLFRGYEFGYSLLDTLELNVETTNILYSPVNPSQAGFEQYVGARFVVQPNTTYTLSKQKSNCFSIVLLKANGSTGKIIFRDSGKLHHTFTTGADDAFMFVYMSNNYQKPLVQLELGSTVTAYESTGRKFKDAALPIGAKLTDVVTATDNTYIDLGIATDRFRFNAATNTATTATVLDNLYEPLRADFPHLITRNLLGKDSSDAYDIYEYVFSPDYYEQTIFITAGMHPTEIVTPFALGAFLNEIYRNPSKHEGLAYLRNKVRICVIPVVNVWGMNQNPKTVPIHYTNANAVNPSRNFPERWEQIIEDGPYNKKGTAPASEKETQHILTVMHREKDRLAFYLDLHTAQGGSKDTHIFWLEEDNFLRPVLENIVSMKNAIAWETLGRVPDNETYETQRATGTFYPWRVLGVPAGTLEYGAPALDNLKENQMGYYINQLFNTVHYALKANLKAKRKQAELNEHNKQFISLYNTLSAYNNVVNQVWNYAQLQTNLYDKLGLTKSVIGAASGTYSLIKYVHAPVGYKNTVVLSAGLRGKDTRKSVTELGFFAHKLMTDLNPHIVALRNSTRFIFIPCLNPHGYDNNIVNNANAVQPYLNFATSTQSESVVLRSFIDSETIDLFVDIDSLLNANKPSGYANLQMIHNAKADIEYSSIFSVLNAKYAVSNPASAMNYSTSLGKSQIADYINSKGVSYSYNFFAQNVLPLRTTVEGLYVDYGYEANEMAYCTEVLLNSIKEICQRRTLSKYLAN